MNETTDAATILAPLWKRKWLILLVGLVVAGASYEYYKRQPSLYQPTQPLARRRRLADHLGGRRGRGSGAPEGRTRTCKRARQGPREIGGWKRLRRDHRRSANGQGRCAPRERLRARVHRAPAHQLPAPGQGGDLQREKAAPQDRSLAIRRLHADGGPGQRWDHQRWQQAGRLGGDPGREPREQDQSARIGPGGGDRPAGESGEAEGRHAARTDAEKKRDLRVRARCSAGRDRRLPDRPPRAQAAIDLSDRSTVRISRPGRASGGEEPRRPSRWPGAPSGAAGRASEEVEHGAADGGRARARRH